jgi:hypothetical protein
MAVFVTSGFIQTIKARNTLTSNFHLIHNFSVRLLGVLQRKGIRND